MIEHAYTYLCLCLCVHASRKHPRVLKSSLFSFHSTACGASSVPCVPYGHSNLLFHPLPTPLFPVLSPQLSSPTLLLLLLSFPSSHRPIFPQRCIFLHVISVILECKLIRWVSVVPPLIGFHPRNYGTCCEIDVSRL